MRILVVGAGATGGYFGGRLAHDYRDLQREKRVESDHILGDLLACARRLAVPAPLLAAAFANLSIYQRRMSSR
jgi:ketopantoate reductase